MSVMILLLILPAVLFAAVFLALRFFPESRMARKIRLLVVGSTLSGLRRFLHAVGLISDVPQKGKKEGRRKALKHSLILACLVLLILAGIAAMIYPILSSLYMEKVQSQIQSQYQAEVTHSDAAVLDHLLEEAQAYNQKLAKGELSLLTPEENGYFDQLLVPGGSRIMGYIHIPRIQVDLPIFHGVSMDSLDAGCGHMPQSSLPVGGESTHAVISAHTGLASAPMFSNLPQLTVGDRFTLDILGQTLTYEIQSEADIRTVLPVEVQAIQIKNGQDLCTLVTCVPFGVNSHRLLVTGHRIPTEEEEYEPTPRITGDIAPSLWQAEYLKSLCTGLALLGGILGIGGGLCLYLRFHKKGHYEN